ncbi:hypothetical protein [Glutamicibacter uratoxydans]|uniref:hypothetical protein n=1 Tax=Glutamicibacter uratoxydans TaxID=43667 RepID=UPI003D6F0A44
MNKATEQRTAALRIPEDLFVIGQPFTRNELGAMAFRGYLRETLPGHYLGTRHRYTPTVRAKITAHVAGKQLHKSDVLIRATAAWIHGLISYCPTLNISSAHYRRPANPVHGVGFEFMQLELDESETLIRGPVLLTDTLRTVCDMACHDPLPWAVEALNRVVGMQDPYVNLQTITAKLRNFPVSSPVQRGLRLVESMEQQAA